MPPRTLNPEALKRTSVGEWVQVTLLGANLAWTTLCLGGYLAETLVVTSALSGLLLTVHFAHQAATRYRATQRDAQPPRIHPASWVPLPFLIYAAANVRWVTPVPWLGWLDWLGWAQIALIFWVILNGVRSPTARTALGVMLVALGGVLVVLACYQRFVANDWLMLSRRQVPQFHGRSSGSFGLPNSLAAYLILVLPIPASLIFRRQLSSAQRVACGYIAAVLGFGLILTISRGAWIALALAGGLGPILVVRGSVARKLMYAVGAWLFAGLLGWLIVAQVPAVRDRVRLLATQRGELSRPIMWDAAWQIARADPWLGRGAGSYAVAFDEFRPEGFQLEPRWAHNDYLNTLADYGWVGMTLALGAAVPLVFKCRRGALTDSRAWIDSPEVTAGLVMGATAFALQLVVDFNLKIPALGMAFGIVAALCVQRRWSATKPREVPLWIAWAFLGLAVVVGGATFFVVQPCYRAEAMRESARRILDSIARARTFDEKTLGSARDQLLRATVLSPSNGMAWAELSYVTTLRAQLSGAEPRQLGAEAERYANAALHCSSAVPEFWIRRGVALDMQGLWIEAGGAIAHAIKLAPTKAGIWYQQAAHLSLDRTQPARALAAVDFSLRLDPGNVEAHALRKRLVERSSAP